MSSEVLARQVSQANTDTKRMYIATGSNDKTFCLQHYQVLVELEDESSELARKLDLKFTYANSGANQTTSIGSTVRNKLRPGVYSQLLLVEKEAPVKFTSANVRLANSSEQLHIKSIEVNFMSNLDPLVRQSFSAQLLPNTNVAYASQFGPKGGDRLYFEPRSTETASK